LLELIFLDIAEHEYLIDPFDGISLNVGMKNRKSLLTVDIELVSTHVYTNDLDLFSWFSYVYIVSNNYDFFAARYTAWHDLRWTFLNC
jgi:hypothetical protein